MPPIRELLADKKFTRDLFLTGIIVGFGGIAGVVLGIPLVGYLLTPLVKPTPRIWRDVGPVGDFKQGRTVEVKYRDPGSLKWAGTTTKAGAWLRRDSAHSFTAFSMYCTHLGCPVHWIQSAQRFMCPCHGSAFNANGSVSAGPAQLPLVRLPVRVHKGRVQIKTSPIPIA